MSDIFPSYMPYHPKKIYRPNFSRFEKWYNVDQTLSPHGGKLVERVITDRYKAASMVKGLERIPLKDQQAREVFNIATGVFSPLEGFMLKDDVNSVCRYLCLSNGYIWPIPIVLDVAEDKIKKLGLKEGDDVCLTHQEQPFAILHIKEIFKYDKKTMAHFVFGTKDPNHPGVARTLLYENIFIGGEIDMVNLPTINPPFDKFWFSPKKMRDEISKRGWKTVIFHQTRNVPHLGHEFLMKAASFLADGIIVNAVVGEKKLGDYIDELIVLAHDKLSEAGYIRRDRHLVSILFWDMRYAGPREAVLHGLIRKNLGGTYHMYGRDHAGVGDYYHPYAAHAIFYYLPNLGFKPKLMLEFVYCPKCNEIAYEGLCGHWEQWQKFSGTLLREMIQKGGTPPKKLIRPEVFELITDVSKKYGTAFVTENYLKKRNLWTLHPLEI